MHYKYEKEKLQNGHFSSSTTSTRFGSEGLSGFAEGQFPKRFVSLGKLIQNLVVYPMTETYQYNEIQTIYYPINAEAAGARKHTTASLPISVDRLYEEFDKHMKEGNFMTPDSVFKFFQIYYKAETLLAMSFFSKNQAIEKTLEEKYGYENKDGKISLNEKGQKAAYSILQENFIENKKSDYPTLKEIVGNGKAKNSSTNTSTSTGSASAAAAQKNAKKPEQLQNRILVNTNNQCTNNSLSSLSKKK